MMSNQSSAHFYSDLPAYDVPVNALFSDLSRFSPVPDDWFMVVTDVKNSTGAIKRGLHQEVNLIATGGIITALNLARKHKLTIPFFFGGDGASLLVPPEMIVELMKALAEHRQNTNRNFGLVLRVGHFPVANANGGRVPLMISKVVRSREYHTPVIIGDALHLAEKQLKLADVQDDFISPEQEGVLDLSGMECRWDAVAPPKPGYEVLCLLVVACDQEQQPVVYQKVLDKVDEIYGMLPQRNPISVQKLQLKASFDRIRTETIVKLGRVVPGPLLRNWLTTLLGHWYINYNKTGRRYARQLVELSDTLVLDGKINTVISGTADQRNRLLAFLREMESNQEITYGWYASNESIVSCYVRERQDQHIHFVDGAQGGYTRAAGMLKSKI